MAAADLRVGKLGTKVEWGSDIFPNMSWRLNEDPKLAELHNARDGVVRAETLHDGTGNFSGFYDATVAPGTDIVAGATATLKLYVDATNYISLTAILGPVSIDMSNVMGQGIKVSADFALASGTITYPDFTP